MTVFIHYKILQLLEQSPKVTQRQLADELGVSLGKVNYCVKALIEKGWIKASNFKNSNKKIAYAYLLTSNGFEEKARMTVRFLRIKMREYEELKLEIDQLKGEVELTEAR